MSRIQIKLQQLKLCTSTGIDSSRDVTIDWDVSKLELLDRSDEDAWETNG